MPKIRRVFAREVLDSRGQPTVEVEIECADGSHGRAIVPSGASTGRFEACELRDADASRYDGRGVTKAVEHVNGVLGPAIVGDDVTDQVGLDQKIVALDGTPQKTNLGGNALLGVSLAVAHAAADAVRSPLWQYLNQLYNEHWPHDDLPAVAGEASTPSPSPRPPRMPTTPRMPMPMINMISGGLHAGANIDFQDFLLIPHGAQDYRTALEWTVRVYRRLGALLTKAGFEGRLVGDEGGFGPRLKDNRQAAEFVVQAIEAAGLRPGVDASLAIDVAATHFFDGTQYRLSATGGKSLSADELIDYLDRLSRDFPVRTIEDGLAEDDWPGWTRMTARMGDRVRLIGDDLFTTNIARLERGITERAANAILIKVNQIGTLSETFATLARAQAAGFTCVVSARSGETEDTTIADLAVAVAADYIKIGSITRSERLAKYNQLLRIAEVIDR